MLSSKKNGSQLTVQLKGKLIASNVESVKTELLQMMAEDILHLILDCKELDMMDSSGITLCIAAQKTMTNRHGQMEFVHLNEDICRLFKLTRLNKHFKSNC